MAEAPGTLDGWFALHDLRQIDWPAWKRLSIAAQEEVLAEAVEFLRHAAAPPEGRSAFYSMLGQKADLLLLHLRPTLEELGAVERAFARTRLADLTRPAGSYVSVAELSLYEAQARSGGDVENLLATPFVQSRLRPEIPELPYVCFYPMSKRRGEQQNWYALPMEERRRLMREHGATGRKYHGDVIQMITGSTGLDDWEWGVTLWAREAVQIKQVVYEMRFDEVSARYAEFGSFVVGVRLQPEELPAFLRG